MENQREIFAILAPHYSLDSGSVTYQKNANLSAALVSGAQLLMKKPLLRSWSAVIPEMALRHKNIFVAFWPCILIAPSDNLAVEQFWDGGGNFLPMVRRGQTPQFCGYADLAFTVIVAGNVLEDLRPCLEIPNKTADVALAPLHLKPARRPPNRA